MRKKILLGLLPLLVLLVLVGIYAMSLFTRLGGAVDVILRENYRSVVAAQNMKESAERMDSGLFFTLIGEEARGRKTYEENLPVFRANLDAELANITVPGEAGAANKIKELHEKYAASADQFLQASDSGARRQRYFEEMLPTFTLVKDTAQQILDMNQANMVAADRHARELAANSTRYLLAAIAAGTAIALVFTAGFVRSILQPIGDLTLSARELGKGNLDQVVPVASHDELGELADSFNKLAGSLRTYRQVTDDQLVRARQTTESTFSSLPDPIFVLGPDAGIHFTNPAAAKLLYKLDSKELPPLALEEARKVLKEGPDYLPQNLDRSICVRIDDRETFLLPRIVGIRDDSGVHGVAVILQDVTRFRLLDEVKTNLVSTVSHELKTPLTSIRMGLHLLLEEKIGALNPQQLELLIAARDDSERLLRMINDLLDLARLESGGQRLLLEPVPVEDLMHSAVREAERQAEGRRLRVSSYIAADLPRVMVESRQIEHVFLNLISNAAKHSANGGDIELRAERDGYEAVSFSVIDHGPGIPREHLHRVFDRFFRVPGMDRTGAGLGLAIAREIVTAHGGTIAVSNNSDHGANFHFTLPVSPNPVVPASQTLSKASL